MAYKCIVVHSRCLFGLRIIELKPQWQTAKLYMYSGHLSKLIYQFYVYDIYITNIYMWDLHNFYASPDILRVII